jgi:hypothetical protein
VINYYDTLKIPESATNGEIELAFIDFKNELMKFSPGIQLNDAELRLRQPAAWDAYLILLDPEKRKAHDTALENGRSVKANEEQNKIVEEHNHEIPSKWKYIGLSVIIILSLYFIFKKNSEKKVSEAPKWRTHYLTDEIQVMLPAPADTNVNIIPPFLMNYLKSYSCCQSDLKDGFLVATARFTMQDNYKISENDISYITNTEMSNHMAVHRPDSVKFTMNIRGYRVLVRKGTYVMEGTLRAFENYSMLKGSTAIKIIVAYVPGDPQHIKYAETVFNSLNCF